MDGAEHTFPLPEVEAHKLDEVKEVIDHSRTPGARAGAGHPHAWLAVALAGVWGLCFGLWLKTRG